MSEDRIRKLEEEIQGLKGELEEVKRSMREPPYVLRVLSYIKEVEVIESRDLKKRFPALYGGNLSRLFDAIDRDKSFRAVISRSRRAPSIFAYFGVSSKPTSPRLMAVDYFQRIQPSSRTDSPDAVGRKVMVYRGPEGSLEGIQEAYSLTKEEAYEVWKELIGLFETRILINQAEKKFRRKY